MQAMGNMNLLADAWSWLVPVVIIVVYLISHLWSVAQGPQQQKQQPPQPRRRQPPGERRLPPQQATVPGARPSNQAQLNAEIEQFLRRANQRRAEKARREGAPRSAQPVPPPQEVPTDVEPIEHRDFDAVASSVLQHLGSGAFEQRAEHMADDVKRSEAELSQHLKRAFDNRMGSLVASDLADPNLPAPDVKPPPAAEVRAATAKAVAGMLVNQQNIRQAVILKEILERPVDRW